MALLLLRVGEYDVQPESPAFEYNALPLRRPATPVECPQKPGISNRPLAVVRLLLPLAVFRALPLFIADFNCCTGTVIYELNQVGR